MDWGKKNRAIIDYYGIENQKLKLCEECAEVIQAILKGNEQAIWDEIADVEVIIDQLVMKYDVDDFVRSRKKYKIARQLARIRESLRKRKKDIPDWLEEALEGIREE